MCLDHKDFMDWYEKTESLSVEKLHELDLYWRENAEDSIDEQLHSMVEQILEHRGEQTLSMKRRIQINQFNKSLSISNPWGRFLSLGKSFLVIKRRS